MLDFGLLFYLILILSIAFWLLRIHWESFKFTDLHNRPVLITGCDSGFGHDAALEIAKLSMPVFAGCLTKEGMQRLQQEASQIPGSKLMAIQLDVTSDESVDQMAQIVEKESQRYGGLWAVINSAGISTGFTYDEFLTCDDYRDPMEVNFYGLKRVANRMMRLLKARRGRLVNVTSISGRCPAAAVGPYVVTKHAATAWSDIIRKELAMFGVEVYIIEPGFVHTRLTSHEHIGKCNWEHFNKSKPEIRNEYGVEFMEKFSANQKTMIELLGAKTTDTVVECYVKSVSSIFCRTRMKTGMDSWLLWHPSSFMPTYIQDLFLNNVGFIFGPNIPAAMKPPCTHCQSNRKNKEIIPDIYE